MQHQSRSAKHAFQELGQWLRDLAELREYESFFLSLGQFIAQFGQPLKLAAMLRVVFVLAKHLGGMIADLLETHQVGEYESASLNSVDRLQFLLQVADGLFEKGGLLATQTAEGLHLRLVRKIVNHTLVGLQPAENVGLNE